MKKLAAVLAIAMLGLVLLGCPEKKGPMEKMGEKIDDAAGELKEGVEDAADSIEDAVEDIKD